MNKIVFTLKTKVVPKNGSYGFEDRQDIEVMKDLVLCNLSWYTAKEIEQCLMEGIFSHSELMRAYARHKIA